MASALVLAAISITTSTSSVSAVTPGGGRAGVGFGLGRASVTPDQPVFDGRRPVRLHYSFTARRTVDLRVQIVRARSGDTVRTWRERDARPGERLERRWDGLDRRGKAVPDGGYEFRVGPAGEGDRFAGRLNLHGHVFPVDGPHGTRGPIGEFGAPRSGGRVHEGFDVTGDCGTPLLAARGGEVEKAGYDPDLYGNYVLIDGAKTSQDFFYAHMLAPSKVPQGKRVYTGEQVGRIGLTGNAAGTPCHLHFEVRVHGQQVDPEPALRNWDKYS